MPEGNAIPAEQAAEVGGAYRQMADALREMIHSDEGIQAGGLLGGAALGATVAVGLEGMPIHPPQENEQNHYRSMAKDGTPPMVHATAEQVATVGGLTLLGWAAGTLYTRFRHRRERAAEQADRLHEAEYTGPDW